MFHMQLAKVPFKIDDTGTFVIADSKTLFLQILFNDGTFVRLCYSPYCFKKATTVGQIGPSCGNEAHCGFGGIQLLSY